VNESPSKSSTRGRVRAQVGIQAKSGRVCRKVNWAAEFRRREICHERIFAHIPIQMEVPIGAKWRVSRRKAADVKPPVNREERGRRYHRSADDVPSGLSVPRWSWNGLQE
jgi:hypothetical protein